MVKKFDDMFSHFNRIPAWHTQTGGWMDGRTDILRQQRLWYVSFGKNLAYLLKCHCSL